MRSEAPHPWASGKLSRSAQSPEEGARTHGELYHRTVRASVNTRSGEKLEIDGIVKSFIPLRNRREGRVTHRRGHDRVAPG